MTMSLIEANLKLANEVCRSVRLYGPDLGEQDARVNDASRAIIASMREESGTAWLGRVNLYASENRIMWKWRGELVHNFSAAFVAPKYDTELVRLILERHEATYTTVRADLLRVDGIMDRLMAIRGVALVWT